ncbi:MAG: enoyl-CoA hydratase/isomerase family protein [Planctomycetales bacterium]
MPYASIIIAEHSGVVRLSLNRPQKRNALTRELLRELRDALGRVEARTDVRLLVLGAEGSAFCAGMDLGQMEETARQTDAAAVWQADSELYRDVVAALFRLRMPTLAVVPGPAVAGGLGLVLACDLVLADETATFALPEPKRGITAAIVSPLLVYRVGTSAASFLLLSGQGVDANRGREMGLCHIVETGAALAARERECERAILTGAPGALAVTKAQLRACSTDDVVSQLDQAMRVSAQARETAEAREGVQAFLEKRPANWHRA